MTSRQYLTKLKKIFSDIPEDKRDKAEELFRYMADLKVMLDECKERIKTEGCVTEMSQGKYIIMRENPASRVYDSKYKLMLSTYDKLLKLTDGEGAHKDALMTFLEDDGM